MRWNTGQVQMACRRWAYNALSQGDHADDRLSTHRHVRGADTCDREEPQRPADLRRCARRAWHGAWRRARVDSAVRCRRRDAFQGVSRLVRDLPPRRGGAHAVATGQPRSSAHLGRRRPGGSLARRVCRDVRGRAHSRARVHSARQPGSRHRQVHALLHGADRTARRGSAVGIGHSRAGRLRRRADEKRGAGAPERRAAAIRARRGVDGHVGLGSDDQCRAVVGQSRHDPRPAAWLVRRDVRQLRTRDSSRRPRPRLRIRSTSAAGRCAARRRVSARGARRHGAMV